MKKTIFTAIFLSTFILGIYGQVETRFFPNRDALQQNQLLKKHRRGVSKIKVMPSARAILRMVCCEAIKKE
ncbi:MAG: hypothetical protein GX361_02310 [Bacteroidales bacterium]|nr:hypothetical protein [Bacteroidales bacterium]